MRWLILASLLALTGCPEKTATPDGGTGGGAGGGGASRLKPCLDTPGQSPSRPGNTLPCELISPAVR
ncbi:MAG: hypothetical protein QM723_13025 [Myxococcaceae bacterium]